MQYKVISAGAGQSPKLTDEATVNYRGSLLDGTEFDSSYKRNQPATFPVGQVIKGWVEALQLMKPGAKYELYIPPDLAYGMQPPAEQPDPAWIDAEVRSRADQREARRRRCASGIADASLKSGPGAAARLKVVRRRGSGV